MSNVSDPFLYAEDVTLDVNFSAPSRGIYVGVAGDLSLVVYGKGNTVVFPNVPVGIFPAQATKVNAAGTTASGLRAIW